MDADDDDDDGSRRRLGLPPNTDHPKYHALILEIEIDDADDSTQPDYSVVESCPSEIR